MGFGSGLSWKGNKLGRPKGGRNLTDYIRRKTINGTEIADFFLRVMRDDEVDMNHRLLAAGRLEDRLYGKAPVQSSESQAEVQRIIGTIFHFNVSPGAQPAIEQRNTIDITPPARVIPDNSTHAQASTEQRTVESTNGKPSDND